MNAPTGIGRSSGLKEASGLKTATSGLKSTSTNTALVAAKPTGMTTPVNTVAQSAIPTTVSTTTSGRLLSAEILTEYKTQGALSAAKAAELWEMAVEGYAKGTHEVEEAYRITKAAIADFHQTYQTMSKEVTGFRIQEMQRIGNGGEITQEKVDVSTYMGKLLADTREERYKAVKQLCELNEMNLNGLLGRSEKLIMGMFAARLKELEALNLLMQTAQDQEKHEVEVIVAYHTAKLKEESQVFDQAIELAKFQAEREAKGIELSIQEQKRQDEGFIKLREQALKTLVAKHDMHIADQQLELEKKTQADQQRLAVQVAKDKKDLGLRKLAVESQLGNKALDYGHTQQMTQLENDRQKVRYEHEIQDKALRFKHKENMVKIDTDARTELVRIQTMEQLQRMESARAERERMAAIHAQESVQHHAISAGESARLAQIRAEHQATMERLAAEERARRAQQGGSCAVM